MAKSSNETTVTFKVFNKEFRQGIKQMEEDSKKLRQELKLEQEQLKMTGSQSEKFSSELSNLEKQHEIAKQKTKETSDALAKAKQLFGENSDAVTAMEKALRSAEISEQQIANKIEVTKNKLEQAKRAESDRVQTLKSLESEQKNLKSSSEQLSKEYEIQKLKLGANASESKKLKIEQDYLAKQMQNSADQAVNLSQQLQLAEKEFGANSAEVRQLKSDLADAQITALEFSNKFKESTNGLKHFGENAQTVGSAMRSFGTKMSLAITAPVAAFGAGLIKNGIEVRKFRAQSQIYYEGLYQDAGRAKQQLDDLMTFAKTTPYSYESLVEADMIMQTFGMTTDKAKTSLEAIANAIAATGGSSSDLEQIATVFGKISASGKISNNEIQQLVTAKIPALNIIGNQLGMTIGDLQKSISKGEVTSEQAIEMLTKGLMEGTDGVNGVTQKFAGSLEDVKKQLPGAIDSMKSAFKQMALGLIDEDAFNGIIEAINKITEMVNNGSFVPIIKSIGDVLKEIIDKVGQLAEWFGKLSPETQQFIAKMILFGAILGPVITIFGQLIMSFGKLAVFLTSGGFITYFSAIMTVLPWIAAIVAAIVAVILVIKNWGAISEWFVKMWTVTKEKVSKLFADIAEWIKKTFQSTVDFFKNVATKVSETFAKMKTSVTTFFKNLKDWFVNGFNSVKESVTGFFKAIGEWFENGWNDLVTTVTPYVKLFINAIMMPISLLQTILDGIWLLVKAGMEIAWEAIKISTQVAWEAIKNYIITPIVAVYDWIVQKLTDLGLWMQQQWELIKMIAGIAWQGFKEIVIAPVIETYNWIVQKFVDLGNWLQQQWETIKQIAGIAWQGFKNVIITPVVEAYQATMQKIDEIKQGMSNKFSEILEKAKDIFQKIGDAMMKPINAAKDGIGKAIDAIKNFFKNLKFPKFSLKTSSKKILGKEITYPSGIDVQWNAKGGIFKKPMIAGYANGAFQGVGEAGAEAVIPLNQNTLGQIGQGILDAINFNDMVQPILAGIQEAAAQKADQNDPGRSQQDDKTGQQTNYLLAKLLETLQNKEFDPQIVVAGGNGKTGFSRFDDQNRSLNRASQSLNSGLVNP